MIHALRQGEPAGPRGRVAIKEKDMDDLISRRAAVDAIEEIQMTIMRSIYAEEQFVFRGMSEALNVIKKLPSAQSEHKTGRWVDCTSSDHWKCSECGDRAPMYWDANRQEYDEWFSPYCPSCGAYMRGEEHEL